MFDDVAWKDVVLFAGVKILVFVFLQKLGLEPAIEDSWGSNVMGYVNEWDVGGLRPNLQNNNLNFNSNKQNDVVLNHVIKYVSADLETVTVY